MQNMISGPPQHPSSSVDDPGFPQSWGRSDNTPPLPPRSYLDIFREFTYQDSFLDETRLYQRINYQAKFRLGYGKAISVLQRELEQSRHYEASIRIDLPYNLPILSPLSEARPFSESLHALVDIVGLQRSCHLLENAKIEIPGIQYEIQRVPIPPHQLIPLERKYLSACTDIGPFARARSDFATSAASTTYSWPSSSSLPTISTPPPSSVGVPNNLEDDNIDDIPPPEPLKWRKNIGSAPERHQGNSSRHIAGNLYPRAPGNSHSETPMEIDAKYCTFIPNY